MSDANEKKKPPSLIHFPPKETTTFGRASLQAACKGNDQMGDLLNYFIFEASCETGKLGLDPEKLVSIVIHRNLDEILAGIKNAVSKKTLIAYLDSLNAWGYVDSWKYRQDYKVNIRVIRAAIANPPQPEPSKRGRPRGKKEQGCSNLERENTTTLPKNTTTLPLSEGELMNKVVDLQRKVVILQSEVVILQSKVVILQPSNPHEPASDVALGPLFDRYRLIDTKRLIESVCGERVITGVADEQPSHGTHTFFSSSSEEYQDATPPHSPTATGKTQGDNDEHNPTRWPAAPARGTGDARDSDPGVDHQHLDSRALPPGEQATPEIARCGDCGKPLNTASTCPFCETVQAPIVPKPVVPPTHETRRAGTPTGIPISGTSDTSLTPPSGSPQPHSDVPGISPTFPSDHNKNLEPPHPDKSQSNGQAYPWMGMLDQWDTDYNGGRRSKRDSLTLRHAREWMTDMNLTYQDAQEVRRKIIEHNLHKGKPITFTMVYDHSEWLGEIPEAPVHQNGQGKKASSPSATSTPLDVERNERNFQNLLKKAAEKRAAQATTE